MTTQSPRPDDDAAFLSEDDKALEALRMSFGDHLEELRKRLLLGLAGMAVMFVVTLYYGSPIVVWLLRPLIDAQRQAGVPPITVAGITSGFTTYILVAAAAALILSSPWVFYQLWQFVAAGLYPSERKIVVMLAPLSGFMSLLGVSFLYYVMLPVGLFFFLSFTAHYPQIPASEDTGLTRATQWVNRLAVKLSGVPGVSAPPSPEAAPEASVEGAAATQPASPVTVPVLTENPANPIEGQIWIKRPEGELRLMMQGQVRTLGMSTASLIMPLVQVSEYLKFVAFLALAVVLAFQTPVLMLILGWAGLIQASQLRRYRKHAVLVCFLLGAVLSPPDPITMTLLAVPMYLLFELGLVLMSIVGRAGSRMPDPSADAEENA